MTVAHGSSVPASTGHVGTRRDSKWDTRWDTILTRCDAKWDTKGHQWTSKRCLVSLWSSARLEEGSPLGFRRLSGRKPGSRSQKLTRSRFAIPAGCGILIPTSFQPCKGGDMVCAQGLLGAYLLFVPGENQGDLTGGKAARGTRKVAPLDRRPGCGLKGTETWHGKYYSW